MIALPLLGEALMADPDPYRTTHAVNPFSKEDEGKVLGHRTHNSRRWSHVFPTGRLNILGYLGLNWKSLTQPAILPLTTDYLPSTEHFTHASRDLVLDVRAFDTEENLLKEMVCQRLSQEFQLLESQGQSQTHSHSHSQNHSHTQGHSTPGTAKKQGEGSARRLSYSLTMGHRIQILSYDPSQRKVRRQIDCACLCTVLIVVSILCDYNHDNH